VSGDLVVRVASDADTTVLAELRRRWTEELAGHPVSDPAFDDAFERWWTRERQQRVTWLTELAGVAVGMLNMLVFTRMPKPADPARRTPRRTQWGYVANVYVDPAHRDRGIGKLLLDACMEHARGRRFDRLVLSPSERSVPFYARAGFVPATSLMVLPLS
jgi:GNAT superfamily N-acetyltransferase